MTISSLIKAGFFPLSVLLAVFLATTACDDDDDGSLRDEYIEIYADPDGEPIEAGYLDCRGGTAKFYVKSNINWTVEWQYDQTSYDSWLTIEDDTETQGEFRVVTLNVDCYSYAYYSRRYGMLNFLAEDSSLGYNVYLPVYQGSTMRAGTTFWWLYYGYYSPLYSTGETSITEWTSTQLSYGFTSTIIDGEEVAHCYGKYGYIRLGDDEGHGGDIICPYNTYFVYDDMLMVSFRAVAYVDPETGEKDDNVVTVEVLDGGVIYDYADKEKTYIDLEVGYYDIESENFPSDMWDESNYLVFVKATDANPMTTSTRIRIKAGSFGTPSSTNNRVYIDNFYVYRYTEDEQDYYTDNGGSGADVLLGS